MIVMERKNHRDVILSPYTTCKLCRYSMNQICMEACAPARDYQNFELKKGIDPADMPDFPYQDFVEEMLPKVRTIVISIHLFKMRALLKGEENGRDIDDTSSR